MYIYIYIYILSAYVSLCLLCLVREDVLYECMQISILCLFHLISQRGVLAV